MAKEEREAAGPAGLNSVAEAHQQAIERIRQNLDRLELAFVASSLRTHKDTKGSVDHEEGVLDNPAREI